MESTRPSYSRSFWIGLAGFIVGGIASALATFVIFRSGLPGWIINLVPENQSLIRLVWGIVLIFIGLGLGGAVGGLARGYALHQIDPLGSQKRYFWGGAYSSWISQGILVVPILLLTGIISLYNNGSPRDPASYIVFFALVGGLFGLLNGSALSLITLRIRYAWIAWLGYLFASLIGGALFGVLVWRWELFASAVSRGWEGLVFLLLAGITIFGLPGGLLGLIYAWLSRKRTVEQTEAITPRRWQDIMTITIFTLLFLAVASFIKRGTDFVTIYPGSTTTNLTNLTQGIHWQDSQVISSDVSSQGGSAVGLAATLTDMAAVWSDGTGLIELYYQQKDAQGYPTMMGGTNISHPPGRAQNPQVVLGADGAVYAVWSENGDIWFNSCQNVSCGEPVDLTSGEEACATSGTRAQNDWPALAIDQDGILMTVWQAGEGSAGYAMWSGVKTPETKVEGCLITGLSSGRPRLSAGKPGEFWLVLSEAQDSIGNVSLARFSQGKWETPEIAGEGSSAEVFTDQEGVLSAAWCGVDNKLDYLSGNNPMEALNSTSCQNRPAIFEDQKNQIHLVYASSEWTDNFGDTRNGNALMETIRTPEGWSQPAIVGPLNSNVQQEVAGTAGSDIQMAWIDTQDGDSALRYATQPAYQCDESSLSYAIKAVVDVVQSGEFHPVDYRSPFCGNHFESFIFMPKPAPEFYVLPEGERIGYDQLANLLTKSKYEILFSNMQWDQDENNLSPGTQMAQTIAGLYQQVKANPEAFPRGMSIKILLGNYPSVSTLQNGDQIWNVVQDLIDAGLPTMEDPSIGWKVELANYKGSMPHSHTKFIVIDGKIIMAAGFNIAWTHLPEENPSGKGISLTDLGIVFTGPVAQTGISAFDDEWLDSNQLVCKDLSTRDLDYLQKNCTWQLGIVSHLPESLKYYLPGDTADAVAVYRTSIYKESDQAYEAALASAEKTIDLIHVNFTAELICDLNLFVPTLCTFDNTLPYMHAMIDAMEKNGVHVRVMMEGSAGNGLENLPNMVLFQQEAEKRGVADQLEMRIFNGRVHMKSAMIDDQLLFVGSQNFHYSSISGGGVNELVIATDAPEALSIYSDMFEYYWEQSIPLDEWQLLGH